MPTLVRTHPFVAKGLEYCQEVISGQRPACRWVQQACRRHLSDLDKWPRGKTGAPFYFDRDKANKVCDIVQHFPHIKGIWAQHRKRIELEGWQCFCLMVPFGWMCTATDTRRFRVVYIEVPRKNAKSTIASGVGLYMLACDQEQGAHIVSAACTRDQAKIIFNDSQEMARREPGFRSMFGITVNAHTITCLQSASKFEALSAEYSNLDGLNLHAAVIDELHAHPNRNLWDVLETATGSRSQPLMWAITTAGLDRASVCYDQRNHVIDILQGTVTDDSYFGIIYTVDDGDDPWAEETWKKANPNYGVSVYPESIRSEAKRAMVMPSAQAAFFTKHLNIWVNAATAWLPAGAWEKCGDKDLDLNDFRGQPCYIGVDLAQRSDITALVIAFPPAPGRDWWAVFGYYYLPEETVNRGENSHYQGWEISGLLTATPGATTDFDYLIHTLSDLSATYEVVDIACDPMYLGPLIQSMQREGIKTPFEIKQTAVNFTPPMADLEALVLDRKIRHNGDPILSWMFSNVRCQKTSSELMRPVKDDEAKKIDGVVALLMCLHRAGKSQPSGGGMWVI